MPDGRSPIERLRDEGADLAPELVAGALGLVIGGPAAGVVSPVLRRMTGRWLEHARGVGVEDLVRRAIYPINEELGQLLEQADSHAADEAERQGKDPSRYRVTPEKFFTFRRSSEWLGVFRGWDARREFHDQLLDIVANSVDDRWSPVPLASIVGPGGSGKSVALRRLAVDLSNERDHVWWADRPSRLDMDQLSRVLTTTPGKHEFLLVDDVHEMEPAQARELKEIFETVSGATLVVSGRELPRSFRGEGNLFSPDTAADVSAILDRIIDCHPPWEEGARELREEAGSLDRARLVRILMVLARWEAGDEDVTSLEGRFRRVLADDIGRIGERIGRGLARTVLETAAVGRLGYDISLDSFSRLAGMDHEGALAGGELDPLTLQNQRWQALDALLAPDERYSTVSFHHQELASGLIEGAAAGLMPSWLEPSGGVAWRRGVLRRILDEGSEPSCSRTLFVFADRTEEIPAERVRQLVDDLLAAGNSHHSYLSLLFDPDLFDPGEVLERLWRAAEIAPENHTLWERALHRFPPLRDQRDLLELLFEEGCRSQYLLLRLLEHRDSEERRRLASKILEASGQLPEPVVARALPHVEDAASRAQAFVERPEDVRTPELFEVCLNLLDGAAVAEAADYCLERWRSQPSTVSPAVASLCLRYTSDPPRWVCSILTVRGRTGESESDRPGPVADPVLAACLRWIRSQEIDAIPPEIREIAPAVIGRSLEQWESRRPEVLSICFDLAPKFGREDVALRAAEHFLDRLLEGGAASYPDVALKAMGLLGERETRQFARAFLRDFAAGDSPDLPNLALASLDVLEPEEAGSFAEDILEHRSGTDKNLIYRSLKLADDEVARPYAETYLDSWQAHPDYFVRLCLLLQDRATETVREVTLEILEDWDEGPHQIVRSAALRVPIDDPLRKKRARAVLNDWAGENRRYVASAWILHGRRRSG